MPIVGQPLVGRAPFSLAARTLFNSRRTLRKRMPSPLLSKVRCQGLTRSVRGAFSCNLARSCSRCGRSIFALDHDAEYGAMPAKRIVGLRSRRCNYHAGKARYAPTGKADAPLSARGLAAHLEGRQYPPLLCRQSSGGSEERGAGLQVRVAHPAVCCHPRTPSPRPRLPSSVTSTVSSIFTRPRLGWFIVVSIDNTMPASSGRFIS